MSSLSLYPIQNQLHMKALRFPLFLCLLLCAIGVSAQVNTKKLDWKKERLAPGLRWKQVHTQVLFDGWQHLNVLEVNTRKRVLSMAVEKDSLIPTSRMAAQQNALAAVNGGFFNMKEGGSVSFLKAAGEVMHWSDAKHVAENSFILGGALIWAPHQPIQIEYGLPDSTYLADTYYNVLLTAPVLLKNGQEAPLKKTSFNDNRHPRTGICLTDRHTILLITADGRHEQALGLNLHEFSTLLKDLGCREAINLDGGGSTTMYIKGKPDSGVVNMPSDNKRFDHEGERKVANALLIH